MYQKNRNTMLGVWGTTELAGYCYENFPSRTNQVVYYWEKSQNKVKNLTWNFMTYFLGRKPACQTMLKALDISSALTWVASDQLKSLTILSDITVGRSAVHQEDPNYTEDQKGYVSRWSTSSLLFTSFSDHRIKTNTTLNDYTKTLHNQLKFPKANHSFSEFYETALCSNVSLFHKNMQLLTSEFKLSTYIQVLLETFSKTMHWKGKCLFQLVLTVVLEHSIKPGVYSILNWVWKFGKAV